MIDAPSFLDVKLFTIESGSFSPTVPFQTLFDDLTPVQKRRLIRRIQIAGHADPAEVTGWNSRTWKVAA